MDPSQKRRPPAVSDEAADRRQRNLATGTGDIKGVGLQVKVATSFADELFDERCQVRRRVPVECARRRRPIDGPRPSTQTSRATSFLHADDWPLATTSGVLMASGRPLGPHRLPASAAGSNGYSPFGRLTAVQTTPAMVPDCHRLLHSAMTPAMDAECPISGSVRDRFPQRKRSQLGRLTCRTLVTTLVPGRLALPGPSGFRHCRSAERRLRSRKER